MEWLAGTAGGRFASTPRGVILHGSRSGRAQSIAAEYRGTANYAASGIELGWNITCGEDSIAEHMAPSSWGWNARGASSQYMAVEFAQPRLGDAITDKQVRAFAWWFLHVARRWWPNLPAVFPCHSELPEGKADGKSDAFPAGSDGANDLRARILNEIEALHA